MAILLQVDWIGGWFLSAFSESGRLGYDIATGS